MLVFICDIEYNISIKDTRRIPMSEYEAHSRRMRGIICNAMSDLLNDKPFPKITVRDIMERAQIQRATFYRYFRDKYEVAETVNKTIADSLAKGFFSSFYRGRGFKSHINAMDERHARIMYKMLDFHIENVDLRQNLSDAFLAEYMNAFPDADEFEAYLAAQNFLSTVSWMAKSNASIDQVRHYLSSNAQLRWLARFYNVPLRTFSDFLADIRNHT
jgi:AcrR family transcriptional regulator